MNITACVHDLGQHNNSMAEFGYRPLSNYQKALKIAVHKYLTRQLRLDPFDNAEDDIQHADKARAV